MPEYTQNEPFVSVIADFTPAGNTAIAWEMTQDFNPDMPVSYEVQWAPTGSDSWREVDTVEDSFFAVDYTQRTFTSLTRGAYRVIATDDAGSTHQSAPSSYPASWNQRDLCLANEMRRRELRMYEESGMKCWVLFRRHAGAECTTCTSPTTGEVRDPQCQICYGTGYVGGYYKPYPTRLILHGSGTDVAQRLGTTVRKNMAVRVCPIFPVNQYDVIVLHGEGNRYEVAKREDKVDWKGRVLVQQLTLDLLDQSDVIYDVSWDGTSNLEEASSDVWEEPEEI